VSISLTKLAQEVLSLESPDLHLQVGQAPVIRTKNGDLGAIDGYSVITKEDIGEIIDSMTTDQQKDQFKKDHELDFSYHIEGVSRFRVNIYEERNGSAIAFRVISENIPTMDELGLNDIVKNLAMQPHGLVLITGPTGSGKSTTLAAMIDYINQNRSSHIITIEDPIEFVHKNKKSLITQRELSVHTHSFPNAIRSALRQDPDVVMVGEMRDLETISAAITLAETGHLVLSTLHTTDAAQTIDRIIDVFPSYQQQQIRAQLSNVLRGVVSQILLPRVDGQGRVVAREMMIVNDAIRNCISKDQTHQIYSTIQLGASDGMILMDQALEGLYKNNLITMEDALSKATDLEYLQGQLFRLQ